VTTTRISPTRLDVEIAASAYALFVHLVSARPDLRFSDNHLDLAAGERCTVRVTAANAISPHELRVRSWG